MARNRSRNSLKPKKPKNQKGTLMNGNNVIQPALGSVTYLSTQPRITDTKSSKHFGLLLSTQKAIEEFQVKSGMLKAFTTEYQFHYWALVARIKADDEVLDIAVPTVFFNYKQEVNGSAVDFHLTDVEEASNNNAPIAEAIAGVIVESSFGKYLLERFNGQVEWLNVPMNTCHVHPGQLSTFSGTDYAKTINDPGICFPLSEPHEQPSFSSIVCHSTQDGFVGKVVRTEYRFANRDGLNINYRHGACLAYWRGHTIPGYVIPGHKIKMPLIQSIFSNKEFDIKEDVTVEDKVKASYVNTDNGSIVVENNLLLQEIIQKFNELDFSPYTEDILAERIVKMTYRQGYATYNNVNNQYNHFNGHCQTANVSNNVKSSSGDLVNKTKPMTLVQLRESLIAAGYSAGVVYEWGYQKAEEMYNKVQEMKEKLEPKIKKEEKVDKHIKDNEEIYDDSSDYDDPMTPDEMIKYMLANGIKVNDIAGKTMAEIEEIFEDLIILMEQADAAFDAKFEKSQTTIVDFKSNLKVRKFLNDYGLSDAVIDSMENNDLKILLEELNW